MAGVRRYQDLDSHKLAVAVRREVLRLTRQPAVRRDFRYLHQIRDSARGAPRNIAEGFSRFNPAEILTFLSYAKGSLDETKNHMEDGLESGHFTESDTNHVIGLINRTLGALLRWMHYLESPAARAFYERHRTQRREIEFVSRRTPPATGTERTPSSDSEPDPTTDRRTRSRRTRTLEPEPKNPEPKNPEL